MYLRWLSWQTTKLVNEIRGIDKVKESEVHFCRCRNPSWQNWYLMEVEYVNIVSKLRRDVREDQRESISDDALSIRIQYAYLEKISADFLKFLEAKSRFPLILLAPPTRLPKALPAG